MKVLVLGASGFIGSAVALELSRRGHAVRAGARRPEKARRRLPHLDWVSADFDDLTRVQAWAPLMTGVQAVVNCVGVLQDSVGDSVRLAHETAPSALFAACEVSGVRRVIHLSAVGVEADTPYGRSKRVTEQALAATALDWTVLRPSLVLGEAPYGGTALLRALAAFPMFTPLVGGDQLFRPLAMADLTALIARLLETRTGVGQVLEVGGPEPLTLEELAGRYRQWLGFEPVPTFRSPRWAAMISLKFGDLAGRLGWPSAFRSTALQQMDFNVAGDSVAWTALAEHPPRAVAQALAERPATVADRWHARLYFVRPAAILSLAIFWIVTGVVTLGPGAPQALALVRDAGYGPLAWPCWFFGAWFDILAGLALLVRPLTARVALTMAAVSVLYLIAGTFARPDLWHHPLGPWIKVLPMMALCLFVAATDARR